MQKKSLGIHGRCEMLDLLYIFNYCKIFDYRSCAAYLTIDLTIILYRLILSCYMRLCILENCMCLKCYRRH